MRAWILLALALVACAPADEPTTTAADSIPLPSLDAVEPDVVEAIQTARGELESAQDG